MAEKITIRVSFDQTAISMGIIGRVGENISRQILFDCTSAMTGRTSASIVCVVKRPTDSDPYPVSLTRVGSTDVYRLVLSSAEVAFAGTVQFELRMLDGSEILKAAICTGTVENSLTGIADEPGAAIPDALNRLEQAVKDAEKVVPATEAAIAAADAANAAAKSAAATRPDWDKNDSTLSGYILNRTHSRTKQTIDCTQNLGTTDGWQKVSSSYIKKSFEHSSGAASPYEPSVTVVEDGVESELSLRWGVNWLDGSAAKDNFWEYDSHFEEHLPGYINKGYKRTYGFYGSSIVGMGGTKVVMIVHREVDGFTPGTYINPSEISPKTFKAISWYDVSQIADEYIPDTIARKDGLPDLDMTLTDSNGAAHAATVGKRFEATEAKLKRESADAVALAGTGEGVALVMGAADRPLAGLHLYGKTTQDGTPSTSSPVALVNAAAGSVKVEAHGRNMLPACAAATVTKNGLTCTSDGNGKYHIEGTSTATTTFDMTLDKKVTLPKNTNITVALHNSAMAYNQATVTFISSGAQVDYVALNAVNRVISFADGGKYGGASLDTLRLYVISGVTINCDIAPVITTNPADTAFEPYKDGGSVTVSTPNGLPGIPVSSGGNYTDGNGQQWLCDEIDLGRGVYVQRVASTQMQNLNLYAISNTSNLAIGYHVDTYGGAVRDVGMCNALPRRTATDQWLSADSCFAVNNGGPLVQIAGCTTLEQLNAYLNTHEIIVLSGLATPVEIALPSATINAYNQMQSCKPTTTAINSAGIGMGLECVADTMAFMERSVEEASAPPIILTAAGEGTASVLDSADRPLTGVRLYGKTTQGSVPSAGNPQEFSNVGAGGSIKVDVRGKNLFDASALSHATSSHTGDESRLVLTQSANYGTATYSMRAEPNTTYTVSFRLAAVAAGYPFLYSFTTGADAYKTTSSIGWVTASYTTSDAGGTLYLKLRPTGSSGVTGSATLQNVMLEAASAATEFEPCKNISMSVPTPNGLPGIRVVGSDKFNYTDSHGDQWICDEIDLERGVYVKRVAVLALSAVYTWNTSGSALYRHFSEAANQPSAEIEGVSAWCIRCTHLNGDTPASLAAGESYGIGYGNGSSKSIYIRTTDPKTSSAITTSEQLNAWISKYEPQVMYPLATPVEIALPSSVLYVFGQMRSRKPATTIFNDAGIDMEMKYIADTRTYINNKLADIAASGGGSASGGSASLTVDANGNATF